MCSLAGNTLANKMGDATGRPAGLAGIAATKVVYLTETGWRNTNSYSWVDLLLSKGL